MDKENMSLIAATPYFIIYSNKTNLPYINVKYEGYAYESKSEAESFVTALKDTYIKKENEEIQNLADFYSLGFDGLHIKRATQKEKYVPISKDDVLEKHYDRDANKYLMLMKQTLNNEYLRKIKHCHVYVPIAIKSREFAEYPQMYHCAIENNEKKIYLIFVSLDDFETWATNNEEWKPMKIEFKKLSELFKSELLCLTGNGFNIVINEEVIKNAYKKHSY